MKNTTNKPQTVKLAASAHKQSKVMLSTNGPTASHAEGKLVQDRHSQRAHAPSTRQWASLGHRMGSTQGREEQKERTAKLNTLHGWASVGCG